jgi:hypothetical protein
MDVFGPGVFANEHAGDRSFRKEGCQLVLHHAERTDLLRYPNASCTCVYRPLYHGALPEFFWLLCVWTFASPVQDNLEATPKQDAAVISMRFSSFAEFRHFLFTDTLAVLRIRL